MVIAAVGVILSASQSEAQTRQPDVGDQPGLIADDSGELDPELRKMAVLYRTNEAPGTIIVQTAERPSLSAPGQRPRAGDPAARSPPRLLSPPAQRACPSVTVLDV